MSPVEISHQETWLIIATLFVIQGIAAVGGKRIASRAEREDKEMSRGSLLASYSKILLRRLAGHPFFVSIGNDLDKLISDF